MTTETTDTIPGIDTPDTPVQEVTVFEPYVARLRAFLLVLTTIDDPQSRLNILEELARAVTSVTATAKTVKPADTGRSGDYMQGWVDAIQWATSIELDDAPGVSDSVREHIRTHGVRQWRVAEDAGMSADALSARLTGQTPWRLADVLGLMRAGVHVGAPSVLAKEIHA